MTKIVTSGGEPAPGLESGLLLETVSGEGDT